MIIRFLRQLKHQIFPPILNWIDETCVQYNRQRTFLESEIKKARARNDNPERFLFYSSTPWERGCVEHILSLSLRLRGHETQGIYCDGNIPFCGMQTCRLNKPDCEKCSSRGAKMLKAFGLDNYLPIHHYITKEDEEVALKVSKEVSYQDAESFYFLDIPVGLHTKRDLPQVLFYIPEDDDPHVLSIWPSVIQSAVLYTCAAKRMLDDYQPTRAVVSSGKTISFSYFYDLCRLQNIPVVTWDESAFDKSTFVFTWNAYANEYIGQGDWKKAKQTALTHEQEQQIDSFYHLARRGTIWYHQLYDPDKQSDKPIQEADIRDGLELVNQHWVLLMTNVVWDTGTLGLDEGFTGMLDWLYTTVDFFLENPDCDLVIRAHPAEVNTPEESRTTVTVGDHLRQKYGELPKHIHLVEGGGSFRSHDLARHADLSAVYTTSVGLDLAVEGIRVLSCSGVHYRNRGFTQDIKTKEEYFSVLSNPEGFQKRLSKEEIQYARRYAWYFLHDSQVSLKEFDQPTRHSLKIDSFKDYLPGQRSVIDGLCNALVEQKPFYKIQ